MLILYLWYRLLAQATSWSGTTIELLEAEPIPIALGPSPNASKGSLPLNRSRWLSSDVVGNAVDAADFVDDAVGDFGE